MNSETNITNTFALTEMWLMLCWILTEGSFWNQSGNVYFIVSQCLFKWWCVWLLLSSRS